MRLSIPTTQIILLSSLLAMTASAGPLAVSNTQPSLLPSLSTLPSVRQPSTTTTSTPTTAIAIATETETGITSTTPTPTSIKGRGLESWLETTKDDIENWLNDPDDE